MKEGMATQRRCFAEDEDVTRRKPPNSLIASRILS